MRHDLAYIDIPTLHALSQQGGIHLSILNACDITLQIKIIFDSHGSGNIGDIDISLYQSAVPAVCDRRIGTGLGILQGSILVNIGLIHIQNAVDRIRI